MDAEWLLKGLAWYLVLLFSLVVHEAAHAWAAALGGDFTAYHGGQVSLDPLPHIRREPMGTVFWPILTYVLGGAMFGWASTPYDPNWAVAHPRRAAWMSLAGPAANLALVLVAGVVIRVGLETGAFGAPQSLGFAEIVSGSTGLTRGAATVLSIAFCLNLALFVFNLIPVPPLDGASALGLVLPEPTLRSYQALFAQPAAAIAGMIGAWLLMRAFFSDVFWGALSLLYSA